MSSSGKENQESFDSTAKMMLEALAKASYELEKTVSLLGEQLIQANASLQRSFEEEARAIEDRLESFLKDNLDGLGQDKEEIMKQLFETKQRELQSVLESGRMARASLASEADLAIKELEDGVSQKIADLKTYLDEPESEMRAKSDACLQALTGMRSEGLSQIEEICQGLRDLMKDNAVLYEERLRKQVEASTESFKSRLDSCKSALQSDSQELLNELKSKRDEYAAKLTVQADQGQVNVKEETDKAKKELSSVSDSGAIFFESLDHSFDKSLDGLSQLLQGVYETQLQHLSIRSKTEIGSLASHAQEQLSMTRSELNTMLQQYQKNYVERFEAVLKSLERAISDETRDKLGLPGAREIREERVREQLATVFRRLGKEILDSSTGAANQLEKDFQRSIDEFEQRIENARISACDQLERETKLMQKEIGRTLLEFDRQLADLDLQITKIEKAGRDAADIVTTIRKADLSF